MALHALGYPLDHPVLERALTGLDAFTIADEQGRRLEACQSPVWDTALSVIALLDAGVDPGLLRQAEEKTLFHKLAEVREAMEGLLRRVALDPPARFIDKYPHELSGGQRQRVAIAPSRSPSAR